MSEQPDDSVKPSMESHFNERLRAIGEQLSRLQAEFNEAFTRLRDATKMDEDSLAAPATSFQPAWEQKAAAQVSGVALTQDFGSLKRGIREISTEASQAGVLAALLRNAVAFADRAALFVVKNDRAVGWRVCEAADRENLEAIPSITLALDSNSIISRTAKYGSATTESEMNSDDRGLIDQLGGEPHQIAAAPIIVRNKVVAVLYADSAWPHPDAIQLDGIEVLTHFASLSVSLIAANRPAQPTETAKAAPSEVEQTRTVEPETAVSEEPAAVESQQPPTIEAAMPSDIVEAVEPPAEVVVEPVEQPSEDIASQVATAERSPEQVTTEPAPAPPAATPESQPVFASQYAAPLGGSRRYGVAEPELPIEVGEEERRLHNDARRFARLLVSEIKLYNEKKVNEGRNSGDIYERLREDIDRSRQMYEKRVAPPVAARHDYFHQELVNTLAEGDPSKLGASYPGAAVAVS